MERNYSLPLAFLYYEELERINQEIDGEEVSPDIDFPLSFFGLGIHSIFSFILELIIRFCDNAVGSVLPLCKGPLREVHNSAGALPVGLGCCLSQEGVGTSLPSSSLLLHINVRGTHKRGPHRPTPFLFIPSGPRNLHNRFTVFDR